MLIGLRTKSGKNKTQRLKWKKVKMQGLKVHLRFVKIEYLNFSSSYSLKKKKLIFSSSNFSPPLLPLYLLITLYFTIKLSSSFPLSCILTLLFLILFCINLISFISFNPYFFHTKTVSTLSLSLSLSIFVLSYNSNLG